MILMVQHTVGEIKDERNSEHVNQVVTDLRNKLDYHLYFDKVAKSDLIQKAINYMHIFWEQLFRYRKRHGFEDVNS